MPFTVFLLFDLLYEIIVKLPLTPSFYKATNIKKWAASPPFDIFSLFFCRFINSVGICKQDCCLSLGDILLASRAGNAYRFHARCIPGYVEID